MRRKLPKKIKCITKTPTLNWLKKILKRWKKTCMQYEKNRKSQKIKAKTKWVSFPLLNQIFFYIINMNFLSTLFTWTLTANSILSLRTNFWFTYLKYLCVWTNAEHNRKLRSWLYRYSLNILHLHLKYIAFRDIYIHFFLRHLHKLITTTFGYSSCTETFVVMTSYLSNFAH